jgi:uncharacterized peroxidase-related enzyme
MTAKLVPTTAVTAPEATRPLLAALKQGLGMVPNLYATIGHSSGTLASLLAWDRALTDAGNLSKRELEQLNLHISELNGCGYCLAAHTALGKLAGLSPEEIDQARLGMAATPREQALLALARRVVRTGGGRTGTEFAAAKEAGISDAAIIDVIAVVALKTFTNAVALVANTDIDFPRTARMPSE